RTVQAPQTPCSQPTWVPVRCSSSRRKSARDSRGLTRRVTRSPLTVRVSSWVLSLMRCDLRSLQSERGRAGHEPCAPWPRPRCRDRPKAENPPPERLARLGWLRRSAVALRELPLLD